MRREARRTVKAAVLEAFQKPLTVRDIPDPSPGPDGAVIRVEANGICRSDWHAWMGDWSWVGFQVQLPRVMGHEFAGVVEAVGRDVTRFKPGDRVVVPFSQGDGTCEYCRTGHANVCENIVVPGFSYDGGYGRYAAVPRADFNLVALPEGVSFTAAASLGCRFMTSFHGIVDQARVRAGEWVAVFGCGGIGLSAVQIAAAQGANVIAVDISRDKLELARQLGAVATVDGREGNAAEAIATLTKGGAHVAVDALGSAPTALGALLSLRKRGRHLQIGLTSAAEKGMVSLPLDVIVLKELQILGSLGMQPSHYPGMLRLVEQGKLQPGKLITGEVNVTEASAVLTEMTAFANVGIKVISRWE